jgi:hypothetical protein
MHSPALVRNVGGGVLALALAACGSTTSEHDTGTKGAPTTSSGGVGGGATTSTGDNTPSTSASGGSRADQASGGTPSKTEQGGASAASAVGSSGATTSGAGGAIAVGGATAAAGTTSGGAGGTTAAPGAGGATSSSTASGTPTIFFLDALLGRVLRAGVDGSPSRAIVTSGSATPDGVAVDVANGFVYWTNMGVPDQNDGFVLRAKLDGGTPSTIVPKGGTFTPKQLKLDAEHGMLYWSDREGMKIQRAKVDGTALETLVTIADGDAARADASNWAVGIALDVPRGQMYWTQKGPTNGGKGSLRRAGIEIPSGEDAAHRSDVEVLFTGLAEPIDLDVDLSNRQIYWTDRGDNTVSRAPMDPPAGANPAMRTDRQILVRGAGQAIGISLDLPRNTMYYTSLDTGTVWKAALDGSMAKPLLQSQGSLTGIALVNLP